MLRCLFSSIDGARTRTIFRRARFWSLDGVFLDDVDPEWVFWQRGSELKHRLYGDYFGKAMRGPSGEADPAHTRPCDVWLGLLDPLGLARTTVGSDAMGKECALDSVLESLRRNPVTHLDVHHIQRALWKSEVHGTRKYMLVVRTPGGIRAPPTDGHTPLK